MVILFSSSKTYADWFFPYAKIQCTSASIEVLNLSELNIEGDKYDQEPSVISEKHLLAYETRSKMVDGRLQEWGELVKNITHKKKCELDGLSYLITISASDGWRRPATMTVSVSSSDGKVIKLQYFNQNTIGQDMLLSPSVINKLAKETFIIIKGTEYQLCKDYVGLMSRVTSNPNSSCKIKYSFDEEAYNAGFSDIKWNEVKKSDVKSVLFGYWLPRKEISLDDYNADISLQKKFTEFYSTHKTIWETNIDINFDGQKEQVYKVSIAEECSGHRFFYFVLPMFDKSHSTISGDLFMYQGRPYLEWGRSFNTLIELSGGENIIHEKYVCDFREKGTLPFYGVAQ